LFAIPYLVNKSCT